jgi:hypothetical protein
LFESYYRDPEKILARETWHKQEEYHLISENAVEPLMVARPSADNIVYDCKIRLLETDLAE